MRAYPQPPRDIAADARVYLRPAALVTGAEAEAARAAGQALPLAGVGGFCAAMLYVRAAGSGRARRFWMAAGELSDWVQRLPDRHGERVQRMIDAFATPRALPAPLPPGMGDHAPCVMGIVNVTPDSFSGDGLGDDVAGAVAHGQRLVGAGAQVLDIGGESTRPGAHPVTIEQERDRVLPVIEGLRGIGVPISIDTRHAAVMRAALDAGAGIVNDVSALEHDPDSLAVVAAAGVPVVLMHARGEPQTMQQNPIYDDVLLDVYDYLERRIAACEQAGIGRDRIIVDPGIGFGKTVAHNLALIDGLALFHGLGCPLLLGVSRKSFIGALAGVGEPKARVAGSLAAALAGVERGVAILRVHDVSETAQALAIWAARHSGDGQGSQPPVGSVKLRSVNH